MTININFVPLDTSNYQSLGTPYVYPLQTDLVGPAPPTVTSESVGNTLFNINWTPNVDTDTAGYDILIGPPPGQEEAAAPPVEVVEICDEAGVETVTDAETTGDGDDGSEGGAGPTDAMTSAPEASCHFINRANILTEGGAGECTFAAALTQSTMVDGGGVEAVEEAGVVETDDAEVLGDDSGIASTPPTGGGISQVPTQFIYNFNSNGQPTISDKTASTFQIQGLQNGTFYAVTVAAVDGYGNVGPAFSPPACDFPAPTEDFWQTYVNDGGGGGGGFCALEAPGAPAQSLGAVAGLVCAVAAFRRRKRGGR